MPNINYGKKFEHKFLTDFQKSFPEGTIDRLYDTMNGYKNISQISDFVAYVYPNIYYLECKAHHGASIPIENITQYEKLKSKVGIKGVRAIVILWLYDKHKVFAIPVPTITQMKKDGKKSIGLKSVEEGYNIIEIPSILKRTFLDSDYKILASLDDEYKFKENN